MSSETCAFVLEGIMKMKRILSARMVAITLVGCGLWLANQSPAIATTKNKIKELRWKRSTHTTELILLGEGPIRYTTFALQSPARLVVDLRQTDVRGLRSLQLYKRGPLVRLEAHHFASTKLQIGRLVMYLRDGVTWKAARRRHRLVVTFQHPPQSKVAKARRPSKKRLDPGSSVTIRKEPSEKQVPKRTGKRQGPKGRKANRVLAARLSARGFSLRLNGAIDAYELIALRNPSRLVLDLYRIRRGLRSKRLSCKTSPVRQMRVGRHANKMRVVLDACDPNQALRYKLDIRKKGLALRFLPKGAKAQQTSSGYRLRSLGFGETTLASTLMLRLNRKGVKIRRRGTSRLVTLDLLNTKLKPGIQRTLDTKEFRGALSRVHAFQRGANVRIMVQLRARVKSRIVVQNNALYWHFAMPKQQKVAEGKSYQIHYKPQQVGQARRGGGSGLSNMYATMAQRRRKKIYKGRRISMYFRKVEIHNLLRLFSEISGLNIITSDRVKGRITLKLRNVPWDQAMDLVLKTLKLGMEREGNIIRIATLRELQQERDQRRKLLQSKLLEQPQKIRLIPVNYANASKMAAQVRSVLSPRGKVTIDTRTNVLVVKDYAAFLIRAEGLVRSLDTQTPQVLIEARIVEANVNFDQQFGIQWGGHLLFSPMTGNSTGLAFPNPFGVRGGVPDAAAGGGGGGGGAGGAGGGGGEGFFGTPNYIVNFPASVGRGRGTALSFLFGTLSGVASLHLRLSAAESTGQVKIISAPKIVTLHKLPATIQQGLQIPFTSASAAGTNTQFISATLSLAVTPQVTTDGSVFLTLNVTNNAPDFSRGGSAGPAITTKTAQTNMLIKDGETMVIGGIYSRRTGWSASRVPFLSQIPVLGLLFQNYTYNDDRAELLIFVTPRIINRAQTLGGKRGS